MQIVKHKVVSIDYTLTDGEGALIDSSGEGQAFAYIQGTSSIIAGLEAALEGKSAGDSLSVAISPAEGYGERDDSLMVVVPRDKFENTDELEVGMRFQTPTEGGMRVVTIVQLDDDGVTVDANHPLAGENLNFDVTIVEVRDATAEELEHGHVHGPGGHDH